MSTLITTAHADPLRQLASWLGDASTRGYKEPNAMALATTAATGQPSVRIVLCKDVQADAIVFFTNYDSRKADELATNPLASACFHWVELGRQARFEGRIERTTRAASEAYFATRPRGSQLGAWVSRQSEELASYSALERAFADVSTHYSGKPVPCPENWGGYRLIVHAAEFWLAAESRLHDRIGYRKSGHAWEKRQLFP